MTDDRRNYPLSMPVRFEQIMPQRGAGAPAGEAGHAMKLESYWLDSGERFARAEPGPLPTRASVVVVGGGFTGLAAARTLALAGTDVVVIEAGRIAGEASGRNGGQCNNGIAGDMAALIARFGIERATALYRAFDAGVDRVEAIVTEEHIACDFTRNGKLKLADKPEHAAKLARAAEVLAQTVEPDLRLLSRAELAGEIGSDAFHGGLVFPRSASLHMGRFAAGLADAAVRHGARLFEDAPLTAMTRLPSGRHRLTTPRGTIEADAVLLATGASMAGPFAWLRRRIVPIGSFIVATEPLGALARTILPGRRNGTTTRNIGNYFRLTADDRLIFGGRARFALSSPRSDLRSGEVLQAGMRRIFPQLADTRITHTWGGIVDLTADRLPRAGERDGVFYALGYSGHGTQMSLLMGETMARIIGGARSVDENPFHALPWPAVPGHFGPPWFLPAVGAYYRYQDWRH
ncbi:MULTISPECIES: NAD(P)/FAD-dependent oxidoreductase [unclassified Sphingomonas]|uniref:NAD(P)/FAD-dependent oxidoreductase n=1 Tax=unclassified Sphingomonas TaxID=196159 RepID=UPI001F184D75|nr:MULTISPECIES: FAD-binding oxidoreductase [unclassified Sphingomonas]